ncbi:MAG: hypothetical protein UW27_C0017G0103 [Parcubacteria group bacterium GW2011_GWA1_44_13]|uniref:Uncharacterized protein n=1 Tax=Candidatus Nomurabacteria bacterium GW2011_GWB1_44_12 TaxID=1618748 RepID=A0A837I7G6_9BACT|nr:MAG: hypothetical protein UW25_C0004G0066 [Candidatus Nomurabacteria bacterium GW2011_GWB1_44_12]KKT37486.1 MAG: hypothetical protein UW27_C0017G0103 [Parcubacteria group bacterium GW2011_GWA1_44_13]HBB43790.1 hypothetical protein [Candidatus Yonathbacteria bacterium]
MLEITEVASTKTDVYRRKEVIRKEATILSQVDMFLEHNFPCPVCKDTDAQYNRYPGHFEPCPACNDKNWHLIQVNSRFLRWLLRKCGTIAN